MTTALIDSGVHMINVLLLSGRDWCMWLFIVKNTIFSAYWTHSNTVEKS